jgi:hypothetical protein
MARIRTSGVSGSSENSIIFIPAGGHSHDGVTSSLISTEKYSIYDFSPSFVNSTQSQTRAIRQENNRLAFESLVINIVNQSVLAPAGIRLGPDTLNASAIIANTITAVHIAANTITADEIAANTITADELVSNIILVNNVIRSSNYDGTIAANGAITVNANTGWAITHSGQSEFSNTIVRGSVTSTSGRIGPFTISASGLTSVNDSAYSTTNFMKIENYGDITVRSHPNSGPHNDLYHETYIPGEFIQIKRTTSSWTNTGTGAFFGYLDADDETVLILNNSSGTYNFIASSNGNVSITGTITAAAFSGNASSATQLATARNIGGVSFNGTASIDLPGVNTAGNQNTSGSSASCTGNSTTATTATNQSGGTVNATSVDSSGDITANSADFRRLGGTISTRTGVAAWWGSSVDGGFLGKNTPSSLRYKTDVTEVVNPLLDPKKLLDVNIVQYRYKDGVLEEDDPNKGAYTIGFIAEDMYEKYQVGATIDEEGRPEAWNYNTIIPAMMSLIKDLNARIAELEDRLSNNSA